MWRRESPRRHLHRTATGRHRVLRGLLAFVDTEGEVMADPQTAVVVSGAAERGQWLEPALFVHVVTPLVAILVRAAKTYLQTLLGLLSAAGLGMASSTLPAGDFIHTMKVCAGLSIASGVMSLLTNITLLLTALGDRFPTLRS
jgi:hypothetical protein